MKPYSKPTHRGHTAIVLLVLLFGGCATYHPKPLPSATDLAPGVEQLKQQAQSSSGTTGAVLSLDEVAVYAVGNNPDLKARRARLGIKGAELYAAGLLPDPQLSASLDHPTSDAASTVDAYGIGLGYDIIPLINRGARLDSAQEAQAQAGLELLWQEWQVSQRARVLAVNLASQQRQVALLEQMRDLYAQRYRNSSGAVARGDVTLGVAGTDLTALLDTLSRISRLRQTLNDTRHELNLLLGLAADAPLTVHLPSLPPLPAAGVWQGALQTMPQRRPDLLALQAGYRSQEAKVRAAILSQFPSLSIGINRARDTSDVNTVGFSINLALPLFSGNRGNIAIERATREQLGTEYQARLDQAAIDVDRLMQLQGLVADQLAQLDEYVPVLKNLVDRGREAYQHGDIDAVTFLNMENTWVDKRLEQIDLTQTQRTNLIALQTLLALPAEGGPSGSPHQGGK